MEDAATCAANTHQLGCAFDALRRHLRGQLRVRGDLLKKVRSLPWYQRLNPEQRAVLNNASVDELLEASERGAKAVAQMVELANWAVLKGV